MPRIASSLLGGLLVFAAASPASAHWWSHFWGDVKGGFHVRNQWPEPYTQVDQAAVRGMLSVQVERGWQKQNLLGEHHFEGDAKRLSTAGLSRVKNILIYAPPQYRTVFVERGADPAVTANRIDAVQQAIVGMVPEGSLPPVQASDLLYEGWSSEQADMVGRKYNASIPSPRIPEAATGGASSGGM